MNKAKQYLLRISVVDVSCVYLGLLLLLLLTPAQSILSYYLSGKIVRATDLEVPFKCERYLQNDRTIFEKLQGTICYISNGDYSLTATILLLLPIFLTFLASFVISRVLIFNEKISYFPSFLSLILGIALALNPYFLAWFSLPYQFFYPLVVAHFLLTYYFFIKSNGNSIITLALFFALSFITFGVLWDVSFHFIPYIGFLSFSLILLSYKDKKYKLLAFLMLFFSLICSIIFSLKTIHFLFSNVLTLQELDQSKSNYWNATKFINLVTLTGGTPSNYYLGFYTSSSRIVNILLSSFILLSFLNFGNNKKIFYICLLFYAFILSLGFVSLHLSYSNSIQFPLPFFENLMKAFLLINRRPERVLSIMWIVTWFVISNLLYEIITKEGGQNNKKKKFIFLTLFVLLFLGSVVLPTFFGRKKLEIQSIKPIDYHLFISYLNFLNEIHNTDGKVFFVPFYTNLMMDNRINYENTFYAGFFDIYSQNNYRVFLKVLNSTFSYGAKDKYSTYEKLEDFKKLVITTKLMNISRIGIISSNFAKEEFQNWRLAGSIRISPPYVLGEPSEFEKRIREFLYTFTRIRNSSTQIKLENISGYYMLSFPLVSKKCTIHIPKTLKSLDYFNVIEFLAENLPYSSIEILAGCKFTELAFTIEKENEITLQIEDKHITSTTYGNSFLFMNISGKPLLHKNVKCINQCQVLEINDSFSVWFPLNKTTLIAFDKDGVICFSLKNETKKMWIRVLDGNGKVVYNFQPPCYLISEILIPSVKFIAISGETEKPQEVEVLFNLKLWKLNQRV
jgi:hypothetical protein